MTGRLDDADPDGRASLAPVSEKLAAGLDDEEGTVSVALAETRGTVTATAGNLVLPIPVELVEGEWLVSHPTTLLFGVGGGGK